ncbi:hypothetical protein [Herbidospora mongoliensis]|uniref:hypothetical protein n=1 Tax=Herbidospora mongoliensis TaxID=688067 RepID=UPI0012FAAA23|nr:hypothetical protein [Herbidospora mongoliensis]
MPVFFWLGTRGKSGYPGARLTIVGPARQVRRVPTDQAFSSGPIHRINSSPPENDMPDLNVSRLTSGDITTIKTLIDRLSLDFYGLVVGRSRRLDRL